MQPSSSYTVKANDNLTAIAKANNTDVNTLAKLNNISNVNLIKSGQVLNLPSIANTTTTVPSSSTASVPPVSVPKVITSNVINAPNTPNIPVTTPPAPVAPTTPPAPYNAADEAIKAMQVKDTPTQDLATNLSTQIYDLLPKLAGETQATADAYKAAGVDTLKADLQGINSQILKKQAELAQDDTTLVANMRNEERRDTLLPFAQSNQAKLAGDAAITRALKTSEIGVLNALALGKQGQIELATETAKDAVALKFAPYKEAISIYQAQLTALAPILSKDEKKQAAEQTLRGNIALKAIDKAQADEENVAKLIVNAASQNAPQGLLNKAKLAKNPAEAAQILGVYSGDYLDRQVKLAQLAKIGIETKKIQNEIGSNGTLKYLSPEDLAKFNSTPEVKNLNAGITYAKAVADYKKAINDYGTGELFGKGSGVLGQTYSALVGATKDYYSLGSYDNGVEKLIALGIPEPSITGSKISRTAALDTAFNGALESVKRNSNQLVNSTYGNTQELQTKLSDVAALSMTQLTNEELLNQLPGTAQTYGSNTGVSNNDFFNKPN